MKLEDIIEMYHSSYQSDFINEDLAKAIREYYKAIILRKRKQCIHTISGKPQKGHSCNTCQFYNEAISDVLEIIERK